MVQAGGFWWPPMMGLTLTHRDVAEPRSIPLYLRSMSRSSTFWHGSALLQIIWTASLVREVPLMFLKVTLLILILEGFFKNSKKKKKKEEITKGWYQ
jgi:hypothetical protein